MCLLLVELHRVWTICKRSLSVGSAVKFICIVGPKWYPLKYSMLLFVLFYVYLDCLLSDIYINFAYLWLIRGHLLFNLFSNNRVIVCGFLPYIFWHFKYPRYKLSTGYPDLILWDNRGRKVRVCTYEIDYEILNKTKLTFLARSIMSASWRLNTQTD